MTIFSSAKTAVGRIGKVIGKFQTMVDELEESIGILHQEIEGNSAKIGKLVAENECHYDAISDARHFSDKLATMLR